MTLEALKILIYPHAALQTPAQPVSSFGPELRELAARMLDAMYRAEGIGLAAPQVDQSLQLLVMDLSETRQAPQILVNPVLESGAGSLRSREGCLSLPGIQVPVARFEQVKVSAFNLDGEPMDLIWEGLRAICFQHELDHLQGITLFERADPVRRGWIKKRLLKAQGHLRR